MKRVSIIALSVFISINGCARFKVEKLSPRVLISLPLENKIYGLDFPSQKGVFYEVPARVGHNDDYIIIAEPSNHAIKVFNEGSLSLVISSSEKYLEPFSKITPTSKRPGTILQKQLSIPGQITAGNDDDFYVINYYPLENSEDGGDGPKEYNGWYKILHFDIKGQLLHMFGRQARSDLAFESIIWIDNDDDNNLWVLYQHLGEKHLEKYSRGLLELTIPEKECIDLLFPQESLKDDNLYTCETMYPFQNSREVLMVGRVDTVTSPNDKTTSVFQYRVYKTKNYFNNKTKTVFNKMADPESFPYIPFNNDIFLLKTIGNNKIKLGIYDTDGVLTNNYQIDLTGHRSTWRTTYANLDGSIYSIRISNKTYELYTWR